MEASAASTRVAAATAARGVSIRDVLEWVAGVPSTQDAAASERDVVDTRGVVAMVRLAVTLAVVDRVSVLAGISRGVDVVDMVLVLAKAMEVDGASKRWDNNGRGGYQQRFRTAGYDAPGRTSVDVDLLQQTVQAVVATVTAAQRTTDDGGRVAVHAVARHEVGVGAPNQPTVVSVAAPTVVQQQMEMPNQAVEEAHVVGARGKENEGQGPSKKKKEDKTSCFRCKKPGHYIDDCPTPFCDLCESIHHVASACHLLQAPKPTTIIHGYANEALMFFELPCGVFKAKVDNPKLAKVTVDGDTMTIPEIIEQLRKIVPHEKFNWEVFHYKDNIYRVKLPSKQEVQRLKNFGTYICQDREACLSFDLWSSLEEPLSLLPEVWVQVSGLPSNMRSDYLSLWGVGTLFGKTLDVDMAYTRKHKVLRTKIGCLDRNLIPQESDVFIRRGFFKLHFEVETAQQSQEVNMVDASNGNDGNDGAHPGEGKNGDPHAMDMDNKGNDADATSNNNDQDASNVNNGGDGMQEQLHNIVAIQIGTMHVELNTKGTPSYESNLGKNELFTKYLSYAEKMTLKDNVCTNFGAVSWARGSPLGSQPVSSRAVCPSADGEQLPLHAANGQHRQHVCRQHLQLPAFCISAADALSPVTAGRAGGSREGDVGRGADHAVHPAAVTRGDSGSVQDEAAACPVVHPASATRGRSGCAEVQAGSSAPVLKPAAASAEKGPQTILAPDARGPGLHTPADSNNVPIIGGAASGLTAQAVRGSAVHAVPMTNGMADIAKENFVFSGMSNFECISDSNNNIIPDGDVSDVAVSALEPKVVSSLEQTNEDITDEVFMTTREGLANVGLQESMGIASSPRTNARPTMEEIIAFGGIPKAS
ncbi:hypothetical protein ACQ4PT_053110 [Festuca glaucescens]